MNGGSSKANAEDRTSNAELGKAKKKAPAPGIVNDDWSRSIRSLISWTWIGHKSMAEDAILMDNKPQDQPEPPRKRKVEIDLRDLFAEHKDPKGGASGQKSEQASSDANSSDGRNAR